MFPKTTSLAACTVVCVAALAGGCDAPAPTTLDCEDGEQCDFDVSACSQVVDLSRGTKNAKTVKVSSLDLGDKFASLILEKERKGADARCPASFGEVMEELATACGSKADVMIASETNQLDPERRGDDAEFRAVVAQECDGDPARHLQFLVGNGDGATQLGPDTDLPIESDDVIAWDDAAGVFNFYSADFASGRWEFHGNSRDLLESFDQDSGDADNECARCHTAGGLVMRELDSPWLHWEGHGKIGGASETIKKFPNGRRADGADLEAFTRDGNAEWAPRRVEILRASGSIERLLEPLFCTVELNIDTGTDFADDELTGVQTHGLLDDLLITTKEAPDKQRRFDVDDTKYRAAIAAAKQRVAEDDDSNPAAKTVGSASIAGATDTFFRLAFVHRGRGEREYLRQLVAAGVISEDFLKDVLMIDFTTPVLSESRCQLLRDNAGSLKLDADTATAATVTAEFARVLTAKSSRSAAEDQLLANLQNTGDAKAHRARVDAFVAACNARDDFADNLVKVISVRRERARQRFQVFRHDATLPVDNLAKAKQVGPASTLDEACAFVK